MKGDNLGKSGFPIGNGGLPIGDVTSTAKLPTKKPKVTHLYGDGSSGLKFRAPSGTEYSVAVVEADLDFAVTGLTTSGFLSGSGTAVLNGSTFTGGIGSAAATIGDIVACLKTAGLMASS